jgi:hypothetical protein
MSITVYGCVTFPAGTITFEDSEGEPLETCLGQSACIVFTGDHAGQVALTLSGADDEDCNDTFYSCWDPTTRKFKIEIPEGCCGPGPICEYCNTDETPEIITIDFVDTGLCSGCYRYEPGISEWIRYVSWFNLNLQHLRLFHPGPEHPDPYPFGSPIWPEPPDPTVRPCKWIYWSPTTWVAKFESWINEDCSIPLGEEPAIGNLYCFYVSVTKTYYGNPYNKYYLSVVVWARFMAFPWWDDPNYEHCFWESGYTKGWKATLFYGSVEVQKSPCAYYTVVAAGPPLGGCGSYSQVANGGQAIISANV